MAANAYATVANLEDAMGGAAKVNEVLGTVADRTTYLEGVLQAAAGQIDAKLSGLYETPVVLSFVANAAALARSTDWLERANIEQAIIMLTRTCTRGSSENLERSEMMLNRFLENARGLPFKRRETPEMEL